MPITNGGGEEKGLVVVPATSQSCTLLLLPSSIHLPLTELTGLPAALLLHPRYSSTRKDYTAINFRSILFATPFANPHLAFVFHLVSIICAAAAAAAFVSVLCGCMTGEGAVALSTFAGIHILKTIECQTR